ncbi:YncE family protein [Pseudarthrobacter enclensis]|uniref:DNA-binding beta-propeller fold protein YncE n=1 Tax=Pseudarthrobacter enclensis TaxID=993070 RepID=A0ABT9RX98_9MICC|nr:YncE family protein [Pseudarthrobacter enclensis]MDP9889867.1 DNA-binding beta-propeller fold protein YncE [Pseudarthrobacter enclensis]
MPGSCTRRGRAGLAIPAALAALVLAACSGPGPAAVSALPLKQVQDLKLPGGPTRLDYQSIDPTNRMLYIAHLGDGTVEAVDLDKAAVAGSVPGIASAHGVMVAADRHLLLAAASGTNELAFVDTDTLQVTGRVKSGDLPDGIAYDPAHGKAFVSNEHDHVLTVIDVATGKDMPSVEVGGETGNVIYDPGSGKVFVNAQSTGELLVIDPATDAVTDRIRVDGCDGNHGLYIDGMSQLAFIACEGNAKLYVLDLRSKQAAAHFDTGDAPDVLAFDVGLHRLYLAAEDGTVSIFDEHDRTLAPVASAKLADHAHTVAVDQASHKVYFPLQDINGHPVLRIMEPTT